ncbi:hypothetical protein [Paraburkholderia youngii]|uniref:Uncharacterized protein n=1 Tax=Paraburkholderia youngii TaxID=2782701 RepID=A0A7W8L7Q8_9BURK|nr:hypothetical protein [Paraburkholderia youngii]MBB5400539.1 hypothetical protein [Paraburkholderia youngii]
MLLISIELLPGGEPAPELRKELGKVEIVNVGGDAAYASYEVRLFDEEARQFSSGHLSDYPRYATTVLDLVGRGIVTALAGREELPPRPVHPWRRTVE